MSLIFCGDLTLPFGINIDIEDIKPLFANHEAIANLEGSIQFDEKRLRSYKWNDKFSLYSCPKVIDIIHALNIRYVSLCNNHVLDYKHTIEETEAYLKSRNICPFGLKNHDVLVANLNGVPLYIVTFATFATEHSLHLFNPDYVIKDIQTLKKRDSNCLIAVYPHWGIEKFRYPEPADRNLAHRIIDAGADIIVGHHPHIIQPIEIYKGKYIIYSIGNFILPQTVYPDKKLIFKDSYIQYELIIEWDGVEVKIHTLHYDYCNNKLMINYDFPMRKLFHLFQQQMQRSEYKKIFLSHSSFVDIIFRMRFWDSYIGEVVSFISRKIFRIIRKIIIFVGLHKPYNC